ncbi:hypothetical protein KC331_g16903 [Hortaea werneckii]|nr:hypothetical protein KC331_g16903 [Hortaea werneckii]
MYEPQSSKHEHDRADGFDSSLSPAPAHIATDKEATPGHHNAPGRAVASTGSAQRPSVSMGTHSYNAGHGASKHNFSELDQLMEAPSPNNTNYERSVNGYMDGCNERAGSEMMHNHHDDYDESEDEDSNPLEDLEALGEKEEQRERELAEQMRVDEEGLERARELSRQGREAIEKAASNGTPAPTGEVADAEPTPAANGVSDRPAEATATQTTFVEPDKTLHQASPPPTQAQPPSFVPMYRDSIPAYGGGFHAVNKPTNSTEGTTGGWSTM